jgi:PKD repeat protein
MLTATNGNGSDDVTMTDYIVVGETPVLTMSMTQETVAGNDGTATVVATNGTTPYVYEWSTGAAAASINNIVAGNYCVTVTEDNGCSISDCIVVTVEAVSNEPVANFSADATEGCGTLTVNFTDLSTNTPTSWAWTFGDGQTSTDQNPEHTYGGSGVYTVTLNVENADGNDDMTMVNYINVYENPAITVDVTNASGASVADGSAIVNITGDSAPYVIAWSTTENGTSISDLLPGNYSVMVQDNHSCTAVSPFVIDWETTLTEINESVYSIYPNPAYDMLNVQFDGQICETIEIYDMLGQIVNTVNPSEDNVTVDVSDMRTGIYFVKVIFADKEFTHKIIVK